VTGITCTSAVSGGHFCAPLVVVPHNYNLLIHQQLFPELQSACKIVDGTPLPDRLTHYERALLQGHKASLDERHLDKSVGGICQTTETCSNSFYTNERICQ
jgi:hypothetical protein